MGGEDRIRWMERLYDEVSGAYARGEDMAMMSEQIRELKSYLTGGQWLMDYEMDEHGAWPATLKRGVLSQDGLHNLLSRIAAGEKRP